MSKTNGSGPNGFNPFIDAVPVAVLCPDCGQLHEDHTAREADPDDVRIAALEQTVAELTARSTAIRAEIAEVAAENEELERSNAAIREYEQSEIDKQYWADHRQAKVKERRATGPARFVVRDLDRTRMRPLEWLWRPWIPSGALTLSVGEEGIGKSTLQAYIAAQVTTGQIGNGPADVLFIGADEDDWYEMVGPRLEAAGADLDRVKQFEADDDTAVFNVVDHIDALDFALSERPYALLVVEQLMDVLPPMRSYTDPAALRGALKPLRQVLRRRRTAALATLHMNKARAGTLREAQQGSVQFGAVARSSFLVARHPEDDTRRVVVGGKANYVPDAERSALSFSITEHMFSINGYAFNVGRVASVEHEELTIADVLRPPSGRDRERDERLDSLADALTGESQSVRTLAEATGIPKSSVHRLLELLAADGLAVQTGGGWKCPTVPIPMSGTVGQLEIAQQSQDEQCPSVPTPRTGTVGQSDEDAPQNAIFGYEEDE